MQKMFLGKMHHLGVLMDKEEVSSLILLMFWAMIAGRIAIHKGYYKLSSRDDHWKNPFILFRDVLGVFSLYFLVQLVIVPLALVSYGYFTTGLWNIPMALIDWANVVAISISLASILLFCFKFESRTASVLATGSFLKFKNDISFGILSWLVCFPVVSLFATGLAVILKYFDLYQPVDQAAVKYLKDTFDNPSLFWSSFWLIMFAVPIIEETLFRGFLQSWLRRKMSSYSSIALTAIIFACFHFSYSQGWHNIDLIASLFVLSCYLGFIYEKRRSIWASGALHMTFNAVSEIVIVSQEGGF